MGRHAAREAVEAAAAAQPADLVEAVSVRAPKFTGAHVEDLLAAGPGAALVVDAVDPRSEVHLVLSVDGEDWRTVVLLEHAAAAALCTPPAEVEAAPRVRPIALSKMLTARYAREHEAVAA